MYGNVAKAQSVNGDIPYAVYDREERTLTFYCTKEKPEGSYGLERYTDVYGRKLPQWKDIYEPIETVIFYNILFFFTTNRLLIFIFFLYTQ